MGQWFDPIPRRNNFGPGTRFVASELQGRVCSLEPIRMAASMCKRDPPAVVSCIVSASVTYTDLDYREAFKKTGRAGIR